MVSEGKAKKKGSAKKKRGPKTYAAGSAAPKDGNTNNDNGIGLVSDPRFASQHWDPRFGRIPSKASSAAATEIYDERFSGALKSDRFRTTTSRVDRFGRPIRRKKKDEDNDDDEDEYCEPTKAELSSDSEDSSDEDSDSEAENADTADGAPGATQEQQYGSATKRLAVQSLDWTKTRAVDIYACFSSFLSGRAALKKVSVYPSKLGLKRLAAEARLGPAFVSKVDQEMLKKAQDNGLEEVAEEEASVVSSDDDNDEGVDKETAERRAQRNLRKYEEERLNYFYAVAEFTDTNAANVIYEQCDGVEYSQSRCVFNLSFVPVDMKIEVAPRETCEKLPDGYKPPNVAPSTLSNSTVQMTWDADAPDRFVLRRSALGRHEEDEENLKAYLASASEDEDDNEESKEDIERKRKLLLGIGGYDGNCDGDENEEQEEEEYEEEMVVKFDPGMLEKGRDILNAHKEKLQRADETPWEGRMRRMEERKAEKKRKRQERLHGDDGGEEAGGETAATFDDPFFSAEGGSDFKRAQRQAAKKRRRETVVLTSEEQVAKERQVAELELLMGSDRQQGGLRNTLAQAESDDDDDRAERRKNKRTRGRRRADKERAASQKAKVEKPSALDTGDERFQGLFNNHLFALDPTHPKFKKDETTEKIIREKRKRGDRVQSVSSGKGGNDNEKKATGNGGKEGVMQLAAKIRAQSRRKR